MVSASRRILFLHARTHTHLHTHTHKPHITYGLEARSRGVFYLVAFSTPFTLLSRLTTKDLDLSNVSFPLSTRTTHSGAGEESVTDDSEIPPTCIIHAHHVSSWMLSDRQLLRQLQSKRMIQRMPFRPMVHPIP